MSILDGKIGNRRNNWLQVRLTGEEDKRLEDMAASYHVDKSDLVRQKLFGKTADYVASEISNAIAKVKNSYRRASQKASNYFANPEDIYVPESAYGLVPSYR